MYMQDWLILSKGKPADKKSQATGISQGCGNNYKASQLRALF